MTAAYAVPTCGPLQATIEPPGSKSITNRALACAALAQGSSTLTGALDSEDTRVMVAALQALGIAVEADFDAATLRVAGCGGVIPARQADLFVGNSGTSVRFLAAMVSLAEGDFRLDGVPRMRERPIEDLLSALRQLRIDAESEHGTGCPPIRIRAHGLPAGRATIRGDISSQFLSGLLMAAPYAAGPLELAVEGELVSQPYVHMTLAVMRSFGIEPIDGAQCDLSRSPLSFRFAGRQCYRGITYAIEPDASAASYFFAAAAIAGGEVTVTGLSRQSLQGDVAFVDVLAQMGCQVDAQADRITVRGGSLTGVNVDMNAISDTVQTLGAVALFAQGPTVVRGVGHIRHKETDRIAALAAELRKLGATVEEYDDGLKIVPGPLRAARIATYDDHRMAMSLALAGLKIPGVLIENPGCTAKTYPRFFDDLARVCRQRV